MAEFGGRALLFMLGIEIGLILITSILWTINWMIKQLRRLGKETHNANW